MSIISIAAMVISLLATLVGGTIAVVKYMRRAEGNDSALDRRTDELETERERVARMEAAAAEQRRQRIAEMNAKAAAVVSSADADRLLREVTGADDPT